MITGYFAEMSASYGKWLHLICCLVNSLPLVGIAVTLHWTHKWALIMAAPVAALAAVFFEFAHCKVLGITWVGTYPSLAVAETPIVQWVSQLSPFGLSFALTLTGCCWFPDWNKAGLVRWSSTFLALVLTTVLWHGGRVLEKNVSVRPMPFSAMMVQASRSKDDSRPSWKILNELTRSSLQQDGPADLILWPEGSLGVSNYSDVHWAMDEPYKHTNETKAVGELDTEHPADASPALDLGRFQRELAAEYKTQCLVGCTMLKRVVTDASDSAKVINYQYNCGCLTSPTGVVGCHEKLALMPFHEESPSWLRFLWEATAGFNSTPNTQSRFEAGKNFRPLSLTDRLGKRHRIAVAICYESWLSWLPQYHSQENLDAICHLVYDGSYVKFPLVNQRMLQSIRLRAIESRTWQLVCSYHASSAIIDPRGRIVAQLPRGQSVLRTDEVVFSLDSTRQ
jgi:apolipoprotein N-acyltransferase